MSTLAQSPTHTPPRSTLVAEVSWEDALNGNSPASPAQQLFAHTVCIVAAQAKAAMPEANGRVDRARDLVLGGLVTPNGDGTFTVRSQSAKGTSYTVNGTCHCPDVEKAPEGRCKHLLATWIWRKARKAVAEQRASQPWPDAEPGLNTPPAPAGIPAQFLVEIQGKQFVQFAGLLALAHERGLVSLTAAFLSVTAELALAQATATFADGRTFAESGDATPTNVNKRIAPHFPRMALTRAKARALRDALNITLVAVEELHD